MKLVKIFMSDKCPSCPQAKGLGALLVQKGFVVQLHDVGTADGLAEAAVYGVRATPSILVVESESEAVIRDWRGTVPAEDEVIHALE